jgi:hypothetical protein
MSLVILRNGQRVTVSGAAADAFEAQRQPDAAADLARWRATAEVSRFQAKAALAAAGKLEAANAIVAAASDMAKLAWAEALVFRRDSPTIAALAPLLGLDDIALDNLFRAAAEIKA